MAATFFTLTRRANLSRAFTLPSCLSSSSSLSASAMVSSSCSSSCSSSVSLLSGLQPARSTMMLMSSVRCASTSNFKYKEQVSTCGQYKLTNRNPRSAELLHIKPKNRGFVTSIKSYDYFHRVRFYKSNKHLLATIESPGGNHWLTASTQEYNIQRHLYSYNSVTTARELAKVLARRMKESGLNAVKWESGSQGYRGKTRAFIDALCEQGISTKE
eukprot:m.16163 g.16163  ORF g.16163 m.16163 type:complete len:215 (-) comp8019_c0_seq1:115-759(-)